MWMLSMSALVLLVGALTLTITAIGVGRARASAAADLAALAAAQHLSGGSACEWAMEAARRNAATLLGCRPWATDVSVSVSVPLRVPFWSRSLAAVKASARAGSATASNP
jgi:secretion/DNA translocation related TadE-like protein